eukprot:Anaeramoba_flamelloidesc27915_g1_i1.p1 GENE.c27915_g1_i1~~c27915_g1_i1.p1  ORF type:complete len:305 (+),score=74.25 c27915_g1_i1:117-917(+)
MKIDYSKRLNSFDNNIIRNNCIMNYLPCFLQTDAKTENKIGSNKWSKRILYIENWNLIIYKKNSIEFKIDLHNLNSAEQFFDLNNKFFGFIIMCGESELRFVVNSNKDLKYWINAFKIIRTIIKIKQPLNKQNLKDIKNDYFKLIEWLQKSYINQLSFLNKFNKMKLQRSTTGKDVHRKVGLIKNELSILKNWRDYLLSRFCRLKLLFKRDFYINDFTNNTQLIQDNRKRVWLSRDIISRNKSDLQGQKKRFLFITQGHWNHLRGI